MTDSNHEPRDRDVLEHNVSTLLETGGERPQIAVAARARIRAELIARHGAAAAGARRPLIAIGAGLAAMLAAVVILGRFVGDPASTPGTPGPSTPGATQSVAGAEIVRGPDAVITELGARHLRVQGAALIDVAPGKGRFVVETAHGRIEVLGTRFLVDGAGDRTVAAVVRGEVVLATDHGDVVLHAGEQAIAEPGHPPVRGPAPRISQLVSWAQDARHHDEQAAPPVHHGTLFARDPSIAAHPTGGAEYPLPIVRLGVDVVVEDQVARVALDQTFHNAQSRALEGMYRFAIPPDAALQRLAMYVDGKLVESGVVERMAARRIYEELVYRRVDPALLEWAGTGRLALRVFPIPAQQDKRLMVAYTQSLPRLYRDYTLAIPLPEVDQPVGAMDVAVRIKGCAGCELSSSYQIQVVHDGADAVVRYHVAGARIADSFVLHVRDPRAAVTVAAATRGADRYLMVRAPGELGAAPVAYRPRTWVILDDVSASRGRMELRAQADVVDGLLRELDENDRVAVVAFDVEARTRLMPTRVLDVDRHAVRQALDREGGVGATDVGAALDAALPMLAGAAPGDAMIVYLGDGVITSGARNLDALRARIAGKAQFIGVGIGDAPDTQTLQGLAAATGGYATTIDLADDLGWRTFDLVAALHTTRVTGLAARLVDAAGQPVPATTYLGAPQLADGEQLELVAKLAGGGSPAAIELTGTRDGQPWQRTIAIAAGATPDAGYLPRLWAQRHIAARLLAKHEPVVVPPCAAEERKQGKEPVRGKLPCTTEAEAREARDEAIRREVVALGKQYFLLSRHTSLLVLENDAMYAQYGVAKGSGETWAPYAMPLTIPVTAAVAPLPSNVADDAELIRPPLAMFYGGALRDDLGGALAGPITTIDGEFAERKSSWAGARASTGYASIGAGGAGGAGDATFTRRSLDLYGAAKESTGNFGAVAGPGMAALDNKQQDAKGDAPAAVMPDESQRAPAVEKSAEWAAPDQRAKAHLRVSGSDGLIDVVSEIGADKSVRRTGWSMAQPVAARLVSPSDLAFDDVTGFVPALLQDTDDAWRQQLVAGGAQPHTIEPAAAALLTAARRALPAGLYRWGGLELAVDDARRIGWRRTTDTGLGETAGFDGATWTRRYAELGLDVTRAVHDDDIALALAYLPVWIAEPAHYAKWFDVALRGAHEVVLSRRVRGKSDVALVLAFDDHARLISITGPAGQQLVAVGWATGPASAQLRGEAVAVGFTAQSIADATQWAHAGATPGVTIELPMHLPAYWQARLAAEPTGSPTWRRIQRQRMAALAGTGDRATLWHAFGELRGTGLELGDLALASGGISTAATDREAAAALAPFATTPLARYLLAGRGYREPEHYQRTATADAAQAQDRGPDGLVRALWALRTAMAARWAERNKLAAEQILAIGDRAPALRLVGAATLGGQGDDVLRVWDAVATGAYRNVARATAARLLFQRGQFDVGTDRLAALAADLDLGALPTQLEGLSYGFNQSRRGPVGWQLVWAAWRDRVLAGASFDHVMALIAAMPAQSPDAGAALARAATLAGADVARTIEVARGAARLGLDAWAEAHLRPLVQAQPSHALYQLIATLELSRGRLAEALADFEAAQAAGADDAVDLATVRRELGTIIGLARRVAVESTGAARTDAANRALAWGTRWRAIDPGNLEIDRALGELLLALGDTKAAWRQLSSTIERDPWSGTGYAIVADAFERQGKLADALEFWQQAVVIDQTDPTPRLRKAQALFALGRAAEGDALLKDIAGRRWHDQWAGVVYQVRALLDRGKPQPAE